MVCPKCGAENREGSNFCRYCSTPLAERSTEPNSGYIPSVPPPPETNPYSYPPPAYQQPSYQPPPPPPVPVRPMIGQLVCPRCGSTSVVKGGTPQWAIIVAIVGLFVVCVLSLFFLLVKEPNRCMHCGLEFN